MKPNYYNNSKITPLDVIDDWGLDFRLGNAIKYIKRAGHKDGNSVEQDLNKAIEYLKLELEHIKSLSDGVDSFEMSFDGIDIDNPCNQVMMNHIRSALANRYGCNPVLSSLGKDSLILKVVKND